MHPSPPIGAVSLGDLAPKERDRKEEQRRRI
jgi:hypothetical protein